MSQPAPATKPAASVPSGSVRVPLSSLKTAGKAGAASALSGPTADIKSATPLTVLAQAGPSPSGGAESDIASGGAGEQRPHDDSAAAAPAGSQPAGLAPAGSVQIQTAPPPSPATPKADAQTVSHLSAQIVQSIKGPKSSFDLTLHPEGLGDVQVKVSVDRNGAVTASMSFNNPQAAAELGARAGDLKDALTQAGFTVADNGLSFHLGDQGQSGAGQGGWREAAQGGAGRAFLAARDNSEDLLAAVTQAAVRLQRPSAAGLDILI